MILQHARAQMVISRLAISAFQKTSAPVQVEILALVFVCVLGNSSMALMAASVIQGRTLLLAQMLINACAWIIMYHLVKNAYQTTTALVTLVV